jgi:hypothetical protein
MIWEALIGCMVIAGLIALLVKSLHEFIDLIDQEEKLTRNQNEQDN